VNISASFIKKMVFLRRTLMILFLMASALAFPAMAHAEETGNEASEPIPFFDREFSFRGGPLQVTLSREKALEARIEALDFYLRTGCRLYLDGVHWRQDKDNLDENSVGLRTFMIEADGTYRNLWSYRLSLGGLTQGGRFDGSQVFIDEAYVAYPGGRLRWVLGQQTEPFSLENDMSGLATTFMERALPNALTPGNTLGLSLSTTLGPWFMDTGIFGMDLAGSRDVSNRGVGWSGRLAFVPQAGDEKVIHFGASLSWRGLFDLIEGNTTYIRSRPEVGLTDVRYVDTGDLPGINQITRLGLEGAFQAGPISIQAEYIRTFLSREGAYGDAAFEGWYAYASWFPFGGSRKYSPAKALFVYPDIRSSWGEGEVAVRYSMLNLNDGSVRGGREQNVTLGLTWYLTPKLRVMANYVLVFNDHYADGNGTLIGNDNPQIFQMRMQWKF
jgi:phosphate-selective porin OprO and OprP